MVEAIVMLTFLVGSAVLLWWLERHEANYWKGRAEYYRKVHGEIRDRLNDALRANSEQEVEIARLAAELDRWKAKHAALLDEVSELGSKLFSLRLQHKPLPPEGPEEA